MTRSERQVRLHAAARAGDDGAHAALVTDLDAIAWAAALRWAHRLDAGADREDLVQEARLGLLAAVAGWDAGLGASIATYARLKADAACRRFIRDRVGAIRLPAHAQERGMKAPAMAVMDEERDGVAEDDVERQVVGSMLLAEALDALPEEERAAVVGTLIQDRTAAELARITGISRQAVSARLQRGLARLRVLLPDGLG